MTIDGDGDAENELRTAVLQFMDAVRAAERAIAEARSSTAADESSVTADEWRRYWP